VEQIITLLKKGTQYKDIPDSYIIFIYHKDYFKRGLPIYRVKRVEMEIKEEINLKDY